MYVRGYLQGSENGRVVTIDYCWHSRKIHSFTIVSPAFPVNYVTGRRQK